MDDLATPGRDDRPAAGTALPALDPHRHALFLDFDGTLAPIAPRPDDARLPPDVRDTLGRLVAHPAAAIALLTGRTLAAVDGLTAPLRLPAAGSHGAERRDGAGRVTAACDHVAGLAEAVARLSALADERGLVFEPKAGGASLHYRGHDAAGEACLTLADTLERDHPSLRVMRGKAVIEVMPRGFDKGTALAAFMSEAPYAGRIPIAVGDDVTDEDAFTRARALGGRAIKVGGGPTVADFRVADLTEVHAWLAQAAAQWEESA